MKDKEKKPAKEKEVRTKVLALKNFCNLNGDMISKGNKTTLNKKELTLFKKAKAIKEI